MSKFPALTPKKVLHLLEQRGFAVKRITGSHYILQSALTGKIVTVPFHRRDIPKGTLFSILKAGGLSKEDLD